MIYCRHYDWKLRINKNSEGYCWCNQKIIDIGSEGEDLEWLLIHEIAHVDTCRFNNNHHHPKFWKRCDDLVYHFLPNHEEPSWSKTMRRFASAGHIGVIYDNKRKK